MLYEVFVQTMAARSLLLFWGCVCSRFSGQQDPPTRHAEHQAAESAQQEGAGGEKHSAAELGDRKTRAAAADRLQTSQVHAHARTHSVKCETPGVSFIIELADLRGDNSDCLGLDAVVVGGVLMRRMQCEVLHSYIYEVEELKTNLLYVEIRGETVRRE